MRVALVTCFPAFPATAGNRARIQQLASAVQKLGHELTFVLLPNEHEYVDHAAHEAAFGKERFIVLKGRGSSGPNWPGKWTLQQVAKGLGHAGDWLSRHGAGGAVRQLVSGKYRILQRMGLHGRYYSGLDQYRDEEWARQLHAVGQAVDAVIVEYVFHSWAFECFPRTALRLLDTHDAFADRHHAYLQRGVSNYWLSLPRSDENKGFRRADVVLAIQQEEAARFRSQLCSESDGQDPEVVVVSHFLVSRDEPVAHDVDGAALFLASDNPANRDALSSFLDQVLPRIVRQLPQFQLTLAGSICAAVADRPNVVKLGWVRDLDAAFKLAPLSINPLLVGTGINIKLLDAMAAGVPTVSTTTGVRGLPPDYRSGVVTVPDEDHGAFADAVVRFATDAQLRRRIGGAAFEDARAWNKEQLARLGNCFARQRAPTQLEST